MRRWRYASGMLLGFLDAVDNLMYVYLPASTASLVAASSLAFSALFGRVIVKNQLRHRFLIDLSRYRTINWDFRPIYHDFWLIFWKKIPKFWISNLNRFSRFSVKLVGTGFGPHTDFSILATAF
jgi:hypothetical protein